MDNFEIVKENLNILEVIQETTPLKRNGKVWKGLCPFHSEKTPSMIVYPDSQSFHCFGCEANGTVIDYLMYRESIKDPHDILEYISEHYQVALIGFDKEEHAKRKAIIHSNRKKAAEHYRALKHAESYLLGRGLSEETIKKFGLGFDKEKNVLTIPYLNTFGEVAGITERNLTGDGPKYINSVENEVFKKSHLLYGLDKARKNIKERLYIVEGYFDVMALHEMGETSVVAYCGQSLTDGQAFLISKYITKDTKIYLIPDNDLTGLNAVSKNVALLKTKLKNSIGVIQLPEGCKDANDLLLKGQNIHDLTSEHNELFLLKQELNKCLELEDEYDVAQKFASQTQNKMIRADMADYLSVRWKKSIEIVREYMNSEAKITDYASKLFNATQSFKGFVEEAKEGDKGRIFTNFKDIDRSIKGMKPGQVMTILGRSGAGKTTFVVNLIYNIIFQQGHNVIFNSLELTKEAVIPQFMQIHKKSPYHKIETAAKEGHIDDEMRFVLEKMDQHYRVAEEDSQSIQDIENYILAANESIFDEPVKVVFIDYFQYVKPSDVGTQRHEKMAEVARGLKALAKRRKVVVIALSQSNREDGKDGSSRLTKSSAGDTRAIEESSDFLLGIRRTAANTQLSEVERQEVQHEMFCQILKSRWGFETEIPLYFEGMTKRIEDSNGRVTLENEFETEGRKKRDSR